jgi:hypothetical protein
VQATEHGPFFYEGYRGVLPNSVQKWLGLRTDSGYYLQPVDKNSLARQNDAGATFAEIADLIESEPLGLFSK